MKVRLIPICIAAIFASNVTAEINDLLISEYIEGSSNNKAIELANLSDSPVELSGYKLSVYFNGSINEGVGIDLVGSIAANDVFVIAHASANSSILAVTDQTTSASLFNGDDAITLVKDGNVIDSLGQVGFDPGSQWGAGLISTQNNTLRRNLELNIADQNSADSFDPVEQWNGFEIDDFEGLGLLETGGGTNPDPDPIVLQCNEPAELIHNIQGDSETPLLLGSQVEIEGIVTGNFQGNESLRGFFIQEEDQQQDGNPLTSEGLFVYQGNSSEVVAVGDRVRVLGSVSEYSDMTQISNVEQLVICDSGLTVTAETINLPFDSVLQLENIEGMKVVFEQPLTVSENYNLGRYGQLLLSNGRLFNPTNQVRPGKRANKLQDRNNRNSILLDDGSTRQNPAVVPFPAPELSAFNTVRSGDIVPRLVGVIQQAFGSYQVQAVDPLEFVKNNPRQLQPLMVNAGLKVASFNVLNYFNGDGLGGGFPTQRGADTLQEFERQRAKIINAIIEMDVDVVGLMEIENDGFNQTSSIADLVNGINQASGKKFAYVIPQTDRLGDDQITVGIIYDSEKVKEVGLAATLSEGAFSYYNRQPLAQSFKELDSGGVFTLAINHFKSKGSCPADVNDPNADQGDGQGCWNQKRLDASNELLAWLHQNPTGNNDKDLLIMGDLNSYSMEDPIRYLKKHRMTNLIKRQYGRQDYSYVFQGQAGTLDHAMASSHLGKQVSDVAVWHINSDEPRVLDYNTEYKTTEQITSFYSENVFRSSDHDPVIVSLTLRKEKRRQYRR